MSELAPSYAELKMAQDDCSALRARLATEENRSKYLEGEIERLRVALEDACKVFEHYDLPEHAFHYRRILTKNERATPA